MAQLPTGTVTFMFTDLEGSTRLWEHQPEAMREALAQHDAILCEAIESHGGTVFSKMGDGMAAVFVDAADAIRAAIVVQRDLARATWGPTGQLMVRMGLHTAEGHLRADGEYVNRPLNQCARLMAVASGGQVLASESAVSPARGSPPPEVSFLDLGSTGCATSRSRCTSSRSCTRISRASSRRCGHSTRSPRSRTSRSPRSSARVESSRDGARSSTCSTMRGGARPTARATSPS
jgi:hypothetical protein